MILDSVLALDSDVDVAVSKVSPQLTVTRDGKSVRVYKRTYLAESQDMEKGKKLPTSRLEKITAASQQATKDAERTAAASTRNAQAHASTWSHIHRSAAWRHHRTPSRARATTCCRDVSGTPLPARTMCMHSLPEICISRSRFTRHLRRRSRRRPAPSP